MSINGPHCTLLILFLFAILKSPKNVCLLSQKFIFQLLPYPGQSYILLILEHSTIVHRFKKSTCVTCGRPFYKDRSAWSAVCAAFCDLALQSGRQWAVSPCPILLTHYTLRSSNFNFTRPPSTVYSHSQEGPVGGSGVSSVIIPAPPPHTAHQLSSPPRTPCPLSPLPHSPCGPL